MTDYALPIDKRSLDIVFGVDSIGETPEDRARTSRRLWVRSQDQFAEYDYSRGPVTGLVMCSLDALESFGWARLCEAIDKFAAIIPCDLSEPATSLKNRREQAGLSHEELAELSGVELSIVIKAEDPQLRTDMFSLFKLCQALNLDPKSIGTFPVR